MSQFGSSTGDFDAELSHAMILRLRSMNGPMDSLMPDPLNTSAPSDPGFQQNALMEQANPHANFIGAHFGFIAMPNTNRLLIADIIDIGSSNDDASFSSSSLTIMSSAADGQPQIYQATTSTATGPGGICETRNTVEDSVRGIKKMAIGHHIDNRSHIIEKEQDLRSGQMEERQEFINLDESEAEQFDREFTYRARMNRPEDIIIIEGGNDEDGQRPRHHKYGSGGQYRRQNNSVHPHPYNPSAARRNFRPKHTKKHQQPHQSQVTITEIIGGDEPIIINAADESTSPIVEEPITIEDSE